MSLYQSASDLGKASGIDRQWTNPLRAQNPLPQWHYACDLRTTGFHCKLALVPKPRVNLTDSTGFCTEQQTPRSSNTQAGQKPDQSEGLDTGWCDKSPAERHRAMTWMQRLKRVFNIDIEVCEHCGGQVKVIASIEDPKVIELILNYLRQKAAKADAAKQHELPPERAPPLTPQPVRPIADLPI